MHNRTQNPEQYRRGTIQTVHILSCLLTGDTKHKKNSGGKRPWFVLCSGQIKEIRLLLQQTKIGCNSSLQFSGRYHFSQFSFYHGGSQGTSGSRQVKYLPGWRVFLKQQDISNLLPLLPTTVLKVRTVRGAGIKPRHFQLQWTIPIPPLSHPSTAAFPSPLLSPVSVAAGGTQTQHCCVFSVAAVSCQLQLSFPFPGLWHSISHTVLMQHNCFRPLS